MTVSLTIDDPRYFDRLAEVEESHWWSWGMWRLGSSWISKAIWGGSGLRALDVGCGTGLTAARLALLPEIGEVVGLDASPVALARARVRRQSCVRGTALALPFRSGSFDVVTCLDVLQHLQAGDDGLAAAELRRVLRSNGLALIRANAVGLAPLPKTESSVYRLEELIGLIESADLRVRRASYANCLPALAQELCGHLQPRPRGFRSAHPAGGGLQIRMRHPWINGLMTAVSSCEGFLAGRLGIPLPFGHSTLVLAQRH